MIRTEPLYHESESLSTADAELEIGTWIRPTLNPRTTCSERFYCSGCGFEVRGSEMQDFFNALTFAYIKQSCNPRIGKYCPVCGLRMRPDKRRYTYYERLYASYVPEDERIITDDDE